MAKQEFNKSPYFDDFDASKNYYRVLFKPSVPIQTRELNQLQSILAHQTEAIGSHLFKFGSMVKSGRPKYTQYAAYVRLKDLAVDGSDIDINRFIGKHVVGETSGLKAELIHTIGKDEFDPATLYLTYLNTAIDGSTSKFLDGEIINVLDDSGYITYQATVRCPNCEVNADIDAVPVDPTGSGSLFSNIETSYYVYGHLVDVEDQLIVLSKYTTTPTATIGYQIIQSIANVGSDSSLYDNAIGSPNYTAPGADRYKINLNLVSKPINDVDNDNFVFVAKVESGYLTKIEDKVQYAEIMDTMARRTYDESGDYTISPFKLQFKNHLKLNTSDNTGVVLEEDGGDVDKYATMISSGKAYVRGRELDIISESFVQVNKARDSEIKFSNAIRPTFGNYLTVSIDPNYNAIPNTNISETGDKVNDYINIMLYNTQSTSGSNLGSVVGSCKVKSFELISGVVGIAESEEDSPIYKMNIFELSLNDGKTINDVLGFTKTDGDNSFYGNLLDDSLEEGVRKLYEPIDNKLFYQLPNDFIRTIRDGNNPLAYSTQVTIKKMLVGAVAANGTVTFASEANEVFKVYNAKTWLCGKKATDGSNYIPYDLTSNITSTPSLITVNATGFTGHSIVLTVEVLKSNVKEKTKTYQSNGLISSESGIPSDISLGKPDVYKVKSVMDITDGLPGVDVTSHYTLNRNISDNAYGISYISRNSSLNEPVFGTLYNITFDYLEHSGDGIFFSVDSYIGIINDPDLDFSYEDLGEYLSNDNIYYRLSDIIDFRQTKDITNGFDTATGAITSNLPVDYSDIIVDVDYYLPRIDSLVLNDSGEFLQIEGVSSLLPKAPKTPDNAMKLYEISMSPYTFDIKTDIQKKYQDNIRYTMRDIGKLKTRMDNMEYYISFNLLEKSTSDLQILDENGNARFKNGFLTDNFKDYIGSATASGEYRCALDSRVGELRPSFNATGVKLSLNESESSHFNRRGEVITLPYTDSLLMTQPYASKTVSLNPYFIFNMNGNLQLSPETDIWNDQTRQPDLVVEIDTGFEALQQVANEAGILGTEWNSWTTTGVSSVSNTTRSSRESTRLSTRVTTARNSAANIRAGQRLRVRTTTVSSNLVNTTSTNTTTEITTSQARSGINKSIEESIERKDLGSSVTSVNLVAYMRTIEIQFSVAGLLPRTEVYPFFDGVSISENCRMLNQSSGSSLITEDDGSLVGIFKVPVGKFFVGDRVLRLTNMQNNSTDPDELTTSAEASFHSAGMESSVRNTSLSVSTPKWIESSVAESRSSTAVSNVSSSRSRVVSSNVVSSSSAAYDPIAQSFKIEDEPSGCFISKVDVYFSEKHETVTAWVELRTIVNGYPSQVVLAYGRVTVHPDKVETSSDSSIATTIEFKAPVYVENDTEYCIVIGSANKTWRAFVSKLGGVDLATSSEFNQSIISSQPSLGTFFKSQSGSTWTAEQNDDLKFKLYKAKFDIESDMNLVIENDVSGQKSDLPLDPFETETNSSKIRIFHKNHGFVPLDKVKIELYSELFHAITLTSGKLIIGQLLTGQTNGATAIVSDIKANTSTQFTIQISNLTGVFAAGEAIISNPYSEPYKDDFMLKSQSITQLQPVNGPATGSFDIGIISPIHGIPLTEITTPSHIIQEVDSFDSYIIEVDTLADTSGRVGGSGHRAIGNVQVDTLMFNMNYLLFGGDDIWTLDSISHSGIGGTSTNYQPNPVVNIVPNENIDLEYTAKIASDLNELSFFGNNKSIKLNGSLNSFNENVSPIVNLDTLNLASISNRIDNNSAENANVVPNATDRWIEEDDVKIGSNIAKYVTVPVNLDTSASRLKIYADVLNFLYSQVDIYFRTLDVESEDILDNQPWILARSVTEAISTFDTDFREIEIDAPADPIDVLNDFKSFQIKIVLKSSKSSKPPKVKKLRALAVT